jgi:alpha-ketoglutaric semialdehyde dehydrogenase
MRDLLHRLGRGGSARARHRDGQRQAGAAGAGRSEPDGRDGRRRPGPGVEAAYAGAFLAAGQKCTATRRIFVQQDVYDEFRERLLERISRAVIGDPTDPRTELGPLINRRQYDTVLEAIEHGRRQGGELLTGGEHRHDDGYFVSPTLFENIDDTAELARREVFGPVASLFCFATLDEALARANDVDYGLSAANFTSALATAQRFVGAVQAGVIHVNSTTTGAEVYVPFGGIKASGWGPHEQGRAAIEFYTDVATIYVDA